MKAKILAALKTKYEGVDAKTLERIADKLVAKVTKDEDVATAVAGVTVQDLMDSYKDAAVSAGVKTAIANYEQKHNLKDGKPIQQQQQQQQQQPPVNLDGITDPNIKALVQAMQAQSEQQAAQIKTLTDTVNGFTAKNTKDERLAKLNELIKDAPEAYRTQMAQAFGYMQFENDDAFNAYLEGVKTNTEAVIAATRATGGIFTPPAGGGGGGNGKVNPYVQERVDARKNEAQGTGSAIQGLPVTQ